MAVNPLSVVSDGYLCSGPKRPLAVVTDGYICILAVVRIPTGLRVVFVLSEDREGTVGDELRAFFVVAPDTQEDPGP